GRRLEEAAAGSESSATATHRRPQTFLVAAERIPLVRAVYPNAEIEPKIVPPESELKRKWARADSIRELVRGRIEAAGPIIANALAGFFQLPPADVDAALLALETEGFVLRGRFHPQASELEWC